MSRSHGADDYHRAQPNGSGPARAGSSSTNGAQLNGAPHDGRPPPSPSEAPSDEYNANDDALLAQTLNADGTPKRPMNAFMIFARKRRPEISAENAAMRTGEISKILSKEWTSMAAADKQYFQEQAKKLKDNFNSKYPDYVYRRRPNNSRRKRKLGERRPSDGRESNADADDMGSGESDNGSPDDRDLPASLGVGGYPASSTYPGGGAQAGPSGAGGYHHERPRTETSGMASRGTPYGFNAGGSQPDLLRYSAGLHHLTSPLDRNGAPSFAGGLTGGAGGSSGYGAHAHSPTGYASAAGHTPSSGAYGSGGSATHNAPSPYDLPTPSTDTRPRHNSSAQWPIPPLTMNGGRFQRSASVSSSVSASSTAPYAQPSAGAPSYTTGAPGGSTYAPPPAPHRPWSAGVVGTPTVTHSSGAGAGSPQFGAANPFPTLNSPYYPHGAANGLLDAARPGSGFGLSVTPKTEDDAHVGLGGGSSSGYGLFSHSSPVLGGGGGGGAQYMLRQQQQQQSSSSQYGLRGSGGAAGMSTQRHLPPPHAPSPYTLQTGNQPSSGALGGFWDHRDRSGSQ